MKDKGYYLLYSGDYNDISFYHQSDGTDIVEIMSSADGKKYRMHIEHLWEKSEKLLKHEEIDNSPPQHIIERITVAKDAVAKEKQGKDI